MKFLMVVSVCLCPMCALAQEWEWQNPLPQGNTLYAVQILDARSYVCVGDWGTFLKSTDSGLSWSVLQYLGGRSSSFRGIRFVDPVGMIVGQNGTILRTEDGGSSWTSLVSPTVGTLHDLWLWDANQGIIVGEQGTILQTTDAGLTWTVRNSGTVSSLYGVSFTDSSTGTIVGEHGTILHTADGGVTWVAQVSGTMNALNDVHFIDLSTGVAVGDAGIILRTTDEGSTWIVQNSGVTAGLFSVSFIDENTGIIVGPPSEVLHTADGGETWELVRAIPRRFLEPTFLDVALHPPNIGICVGSAGYISQTTNSGLTWVELSSGHSTVTDISDLAFLDEQIGIGVGHSAGPPNVFLTTDGGTTWSTQFLNGNLNSGWFSSTQHATVVGATGINGIIWRTIDQGKTWKSTIPFANLNDVHYRDSLRGMAVGEGGVIMYTSDGGASWQNQKSGTLAELRGISMVDESNAVAVGGRVQPPVSVLLRTTDAGATWQSISIPTNDLLNSVSFAGPSTGVAVGLGGTILRTTDGGTSWTIVVSNTTDELVDVKFNRDGSTGYAVSPWSFAGGTILKTTDSGITWEVERSSGVGGAVSPKGDVGWSIAGSDGAILHKSEVTDIPCDDISSFQARCLLGGVMQARIILRNSSYTGEVVEFVIDGVPYEATIAENRRAQLSIPGFNSGIHLVELTDPPSCFDPVKVTCPAGRLERPR